MILPEVSNIERKSGDDMSEYYAIIRSTSELQHYGVKGMKWGVRKAIDRGNDRSLERHYKKAARKLRKLEWKANPEQQMKYAKTNDKVAKAGFKVGLAGIGTAVGANVAGRALTNAYRKAHNAFYYPGYDLDAIKRVKAFESGNKDLYDQMQSERYNQWNRYKTASDNHVKYGNAAGKVEDIASRVGAIGLGIGIGSKAVSANAKWRATKGNAKMKQNRDTWKKEMREAFKNTKYQSLPSYESLRIKNKKR